MNTAVDAAYILQALDRLIQLCEATGKFLPTKFSSRHFLKAQEYGLAFNGVYRFVEGNKAFRDTMPEPYFVLYDLYKDDEYGPSRTKIYEWQDESIG